MEQFISTRNNFLARQTPSEVYYLCSSRRKAFISNKGHLLFLKIFKSPHPQIFQTQSNKKDSGAHKFGKCLYYSLMQLIFGRIQLILNRVSLYFAGSQNLDDQNSTWQVKA